jgi:hypothetical protein
MSLETVFIDLPASLGTGLLRSGVDPLLRAEFRALCDGVMTGGVGECEGEGRTREDTCFSLDLGGGFSAADLSNSLSSSAISSCSLPITGINQGGRGERTKRNGRILINIPTLRERERKKLTIRNTFIGEVSIIILQRTIRLVLYL